MHTAARTLSHREEDSGLFPTDESERCVVIDSLLHSRLFEQRSLWEAAAYLQLPGGGPYVVIAAEVEGVGREALPQIEAKLRGLDLYSAWRLLPDLHVGIVHFKTEQHLAKVLALVSRMAENRVGVSPRFDNLRDTAEALHYARVVLRGRFDPERPVRLFDGSILGCAAVSAPEVMVKLVTPIIECFADLADDDAHEWNWSDNGRWLAVAVFRAGDIGTFGKIYIACGPVHPADPKGQCHHAYSHG